MSIGLKMWSLERLQCKKLTTDDAWGTVTIANSEHRWAKNVDGWTDGHGWTVSDHNSSGELKTGMAELCFLCIAPLNNGFYQRIKLKLIHSFYSLEVMVWKKFKLKIKKFVCLGFYAASTVFQLFKGDSSQISVSWTIFDQYMYLTSSLSRHWWTIHNP